MKITKSQLQQIVKEELKNFFEGGGFSRVYAKGEDRPYAIMKKDQGLERYLRQYIGKLIGNPNDPTHDPYEVVKALQSFIGQLALKSRAKSTSTPPRLSPTVRTMSPLEEKLLKIIMEELQIVLLEKEQYVKSFYKSKENRADHLIDKGVDPDIAYGIADKQMDKAGKKKKKKSKRGKK